MEHIYTSEQASELLNTLKPFYSVVRFVNPATQQILLTTEECPPDTICSSVWGRCERCENCSSLRALQTKSSAYKVELCNSHIFWILSQYLYVDGEPCIMEMVSDATERLMLDSDQKDSIGQIISDFNHMIVTDPLTGLYNRRFLDENFMPSLDCCRDHDTTVNVAMLDIDGFKQVNDLYGHQAGDALLKDVSGYWKRCFDSREKEKERLVVRYGGDEILILSCGTTLEDFRAEVGQYYRNMRKLCYCDKNTQIPISITFGSASSAELPAPWRWSDLLDLADRRMYAGKTARKDRLNTSAQPASCGRR